MGNMAYSDKQRADYLELAAEVGITRAKRTLGFPASWNTARRWVEAAGIEVPLDEIKAKAKEHHDWYKTEELLIVGQEALARISEQMTTDESLTPDDIKKLSESYQKVANTWLLLQGKANNISESRHKDSTDLALMDLINEEKMKNTTLEQEAVYA